MLYLDVDVFIYAALNLEDTGDRARTILGKVQRGEMSAALSAITFYKLIRAVKK